MREIGYTSIALVLETWDAARFQVKEFESEFGHKAVQKYVCFVGLLFVVVILLRFVFLFSKSPLL